MKLTANFTLDELVKSQAEIEINIDGTKTIKKLILE